MAGLLAPHVFTAEEEAKLRQFFDRLDREKAGFIAAEELRRVCLEALGRAMKAERAEEIMQQLILRCDPERVGRITYENFVKAMSVVLPKLVVALLLVSAFRTLDPDNTGFIARADLERLVYDCGAKIEKARLDELIMKTNPAADGRIEFQLFLAGLVAHLQSV